ncbi:MAG: DMT family transporter [Spirochaetaceae bacterium]|jgi:drug/metabolite transporter (DMT)-like permease|nr:DMT family transporter [Spirochaetaceae bacterium]
MKPNGLSPVNHRPSSHAGEGAVLLCALFWSTSGLFIKLIDWHPLIIAGLRSFVAALFMLTIRFLFPRRGKGKRQPFPLIAGGLAYALTMICFVIANKLTSSANAILLEYSAPVWAALLGWVLIKERPHWEHWLALALVMGGLYLFFRDGLAGGSLLGDGIALLAGIFFGINSVCMRMQKEGNPSDSMLCAHIITSLCCLPFLLIFPPTFTVQSTFSILFMGIIQIGCASLLFGFGIKRIPAVQAMLTAMAEPILNPVWVLLVTGEKPSLSALMGGGIIVTAVLISTLVSKRRGA